MSDRPEAAVRFKDKEQGIIEGLIVPFTGPLPGDQDLYGTRFSANTDLALDWFPEGGRPGLYSHGFDEELEAEVIGREIRSTQTDRGIWLEAQLDKAHRYADEILDLVDRGALALSSGAVDHLVRINRSTRDVERWPWVEWSLVPNPGNPEALIYHVRSTDAIKHAPEVAVRIVEDLEHLIPTEEAEPEPPTPVRLVDADQGVINPLDIVRNAVRDLQPDNLHDLAVEMGAACIANSNVPQSQPTVTITAPAAEVRMLDDALRDEIAALARQTAHDLLK